MKYEMGKHATSPLEKSAKKYKKGEWYKGVDSKVVKNMGSVKQLEAELDAGNIGKDIGMSANEAMKAMRTMAKKIKLGRKFKKD